VLLGLFLRVVTVVTSQEGILVRSRARSLPALCPATTGLRFHDLRHHAITELAESQASDQTVMAIAGHVSPRGMLAHYSDVRLEAKRNALDAISSRRSDERK